MRDPLAGRDGGCCQHRSAAERYGQILVAREASGTPMSGFDAQIAAICASRSAELATRNTTDFTGIGIDLADPWTDPH